MTLDSPQAADLCLAQPQIIDGRAGVSQRVMKTTERNREHFKQRKKDRVPNKEPEERS